MIKNYIERFLFFPSKELKKFPSNININFEDIFLEDNNKKIHGWYINGKNDNDISKNKVILFFHGNAGNISFRINYIKNFYELGFSLLFFDYPGFGLSEGNPNEYSCVEGGKIFYNYLVNKKNFEKKNIIFYGESIGGAISSLLANELNIKYLIVQSTFTDIKLIIKNMVSIDLFNIFTVGFETLNNIKLRNKINISFSSF